PTEEIYASVRAIRDLLRESSRPPFDAVLAPHRPTITPRATNARTYAVGSPAPENWALVQRLADELERRAAGPLPYRRSTEWPGGTAWDVAKSYGPRDERAAPQQSIGWFLDDEPGAGLHAIREFPYATAEGAEVNVRSARDFGGDLIRALE